MELGRMDGGGSRDVRGSFTSASGSLPKSGSVPWPHSPRSCLLFLLSTQRGRGTVPSSPHQNLPSPIHSADPLRKMELLPPNSIKTGEEKPRASSLRPESEPGEPSDDMCCVPGTVFTSHVLGTQQHLWLFSVLPEGSGHLPVPPPSLRQPWSHSPDI